MKPILCPIPVVGVVSAAQLRSLARDGSESKLERAVLAGQGRRLLAEAESLPLTHHLPALVAKCDALHKAVEKGSLLELQEVLEADYNRRKIVMCRDEAGVGLLHKAIYFDYMDIARYLVENYPQLVHMKDSEGRTPLHYACLCRSPAEAACLLEGAGAARGARDAAGRTPARYRAAGRALLALPTAATDMPADRSPPGLVIKRHNIRIWCHDCDMSRLQRVVWEGHGTRLLSEVSNQPVVKKFLEAVPYIMNTVRDIHQAVVDNDLEALMKHSGDPVPPQALSSRDANNMTVMHKAAGLGHGGILKYIAERYPQGINDVDNDGRTPLHYAAAMRDDQHTYNTLVSLGADESVVDNKNKTPAYYVSRPQEIDKNLLKTVPDAPRTPSSAYPPSWDWKLLDNYVIKDAIKKTRKKNFRASTENISLKTTNTMSDSTADHKASAMKASSTHEFIKDLPDLDEGKPSNTEPEHEEESEQENNKETELQGEEQIHEEPDEENEPETTNANDEVDESAEPIQSTDEPPAEDHVDDNGESIVTCGEGDESEEAIHEPEEADHNNTVSTEQEDHKDIEEESDEKDNQQDHNDETENSNDTIQNGHAENTPADENEPDVESTEEPEQDNQQNDAIVESDHNPGESDQESSPKKKLQNEGDDATTNEGCEGNGQNTQESLIEGIISGEAEQDSQDASITQRDESVHGEVLVVNNETDPEVSDLINTANMEMLATLVLNGEGARLIGRQSGNAELQSFLDNVPLYMQKINQVHVAARDGNLKDLQSALDRRKFAIARDPISPNGATPMHVATIFGKTNIIKYLGSRFPETLSAVDFEGRSALHYAAVLPDNGHYYNLMQQLGANSKDLDDNGNSAEDYVKDPSLLSFDHLIADFGISEEEATKMFSDKGPAVPDNGHMDIPIFHTEEGRYLAKSLGDPLIKGLTEVANVKPKDPVAFLASFLHNFPEHEKPRLGTPQVKESNIVVAQAAEVENEQPPVSEQVLAGVAKPPRSAARTATRPHRPIDVVTVDPQPATSPDAPETAFSSAKRDEHGQSMLHFAAARTHARNALFQLLQESDVSLGYRDELYRTARDVSTQANVPENTVEIDRFVLHLAARGETEKIMELVMEGYDHILDVVDEEGASITDVVAQRGDTAMSNMLASIPAFEESRDVLLAAVRRGELAAVKAAVEAEGGRTLVRSHNSFGRTALHIAVLAENEEIVDYLAESCPELLRIGDNLERTPLHYAMGVQKIEALSRVLIRAGAKRVLKDLKGRQPSYYFMNKSDILRLQEEEEIY